LSRAACFAASTSIFVLNAASSALRLEKLGLPVMPALMALPSATFSFTDFFDSSSLTEFMFASS
jgi:hypothetical protein